MNGRCVCLFCLLISIVSTVGISFPTASAQQTNIAPPQQTGGQSETQQAQETSEAQEDQPEDATKRRRRDLDNWQRDFNNILRLHDPSTIVREGDTYWIVHTGTGVGSIFSNDLKEWKRGPNLLKEMPDWVQEVVPNHRGYYWAPDIIKVGDRYLVYFSVSSFGKNESAIGLISSPTLDPDADNYHWTDHGIVVRTRTESDHNAIDPSVCLTSEGELWMSYGSFWSGLKLVQLDPETGMLAEPDKEPISVAYHEQIEAPGLYEKDGYFYLFINWGWCCRGVNSTYNIRVGRSKNIVGPYLDRDGVDLRKRGGTLVLETEEEEIGPGHAGLLKTEDGWLLSYHYYDADNRGRSRLGTLPLKWTEDGWPEVDVQPKTDRQPESESPTERSKD